MRSLKECYEIAKKYHVYWSGDWNHCKYMCWAAENAYRRCRLTSEEFIRLKRDATSLVEAHDPSAMFLIQALGDVSDEEVKAYWDDYIDNLENQDG